MELVIFIALVGFVIWLVVRKFQKKAETKEKWEALPVEGPMRINLQEEDVAAGSFNSKRFKCTLKIHIQISQSDWKTIAQMGLMDHVVFSSPQAAGDPNDPDNYTHWKIRDLKIFDGTEGQRSGCAFHNVIQMQEAKAQLLTNLTAVRSQIDAKKHGSKKETIEI